MFQAALRSNNGTRITHVERLHWRTRSVGRRACMAASSRRENGKLSAHSSHSFRTVDMSKLSADASRKLATNRKIHFYSLFFLDAAAAASKYA